MELYAILKDFQTLAAAIIALCAAGLTFYGVQRSAAINYKSAQDAAAVNVMWQREQAERARRNRQAAAITWLYRQVAAARLKMDGALVQLVRFEAVYNMVKKDQAAARTSEYFISAAEAVMSIRGIYELADLVRADLEFLINLDPEDQSQFFSATGTLLNFDSSINSAKNSIRAFLDEKNEPWIEGESEIDLMIRGPKSDAIFWFELVKKHEKQIADRYNQVGGKNRGEVSAPSNNV